MTGLKECNRFNAKFNIYASLKGKVLGEGGDKGVITANVWSEDFKWALDHELEHWKHSRTHCRGL